MQQVSSIKRYNRLFGGDVVQAEHGEMVFYSDLVSLLDACETRNPATSDLAEEYASEYRRGWQRGIVFGAGFVLFLLTLGAICEALK